MTQELNNRVNKIESQINSHEAECLVRHKRIDENFVRIDKNLDELKSDVKSNTKYILIGIGIMIALAEVIPLFIGK